MRESKDLNQTIIEVRKLAHNRLVQFSKLAAEDCKETYLFGGEHFCGIKFALGPFKAEWRIEQTEILFSRNGTQIGMADLNPQESRRAA